jgi:histidyl-tRNA synthetase
VDRLLEKMAHHEQIAGISRALDFMEELSTLSGPPDVVINRARDLLARYGIDPSPLDDLAETLTLLAEYQLLPHLIQLDLGLSRGLTYYTGMVFEIYQTEDGDLRQLCGGGRYDDLVGTLGGPPDVCAAGFSYGLERVYLAKQGADEAPPSPVDALIIPVEDADRPAMLHIAEKLRATGLRVEVSVRERGLRASIRYADRCAIPFVIILGPEERSAGKAVLRDMARREEQQVDMDTLGELIKGKR